MNDPENSSMEERAQLIELNELYLKKRRKMLSEDPNSGYYDDRWDADAESEQAN